MTEDPQHPEGVDDPAVTAQLVPLEESLWRGATRFDREWMERVLHRDFHEFGRSGRRWSREEIVDAPAVTIDVAWPPRELRVRVVAPGVALLTYVVDGATGASNRSSLWLREGGVTGTGTTGGWRLRFHQGGPGAA